MKSQCISKEQRKVILGPGELLGMVELNWYYTALNIYIYVTGFLADLINVMNKVSQEDLSKIR